METVNFSDFDDQKSFHQCLTQAKSFDSQNYVLDFSASTSKCAFNVGVEGFKALLEERSQAATPHSNTRWINIWKPEKQQDVLKLLGKEYGFSPRLLLSMCSYPRKAVASSQRPESQHRNYHEYFRMGARNRKTGQHLTVPTAPESLGHEIASIDGPKQVGYSHFSDINHYKIVSEVWHFASVDWGHRFTCIGFNSIYQTAGLSVPPDKQLNNNKPAGKRIWAWLVLCDDNTVISIHENPYPEGRGYSQTELLSIRHNLLNVFKQLSTVIDASDPPNPIMTVHIRPGIRYTHQGRTRISEKDSPSLLFYYLFDDWYTTYSLVARSEHQYGAHLERTREEMFRVADIKNINDLHHFGRQLAVLKRIYQSYIMLIERVLKGPQATKRTREDEDDFEGTSKLEIADANLQDEKNYGVILSTGASVRFERLRDRIALYALNEIQDCLDEKEALVMLNFNLIALRESSYVERLTRITILLAKVTIIFIPVSLMSTYFTVPFTGISENYTPTIYWVSFAVVFFLSFILLVVFGRLSGTQEGKPVYRSFTRVGIEAWKRFFGKRQLNNLSKEEDAMS